MSGVPIFYHCRPGYYDDQVATKRENKALNHSAWAFRAGQKVKVMMYEDDLMRLSATMSPPCTATPRPPGNALTSSVSSGTGASGAGGFLISPP